MWILTGLLLRHSVLIAVFAMVIEYVIAAVVFANPLRIPTQKILYATRFPRIAGGQPSPLTARWLDANKEMLKRTNFFVFRGVGGVGDDGFYEAHHGSFKDRVDIDMDRRDALWVQDKNP